MSHDQLDLGLDGPATRRPDPFLLAQLGLSVASLPHLLFLARLDRIAGEDLAQRLLAGIPALAALQGFDRFLAEEVIKEEFERTIGARRGEFDPDDPGDGEEHPDSGESVVIPFQRAA